MYMNLLLKNRMIFYKSIHLEFKISCKIIYKLTWKNSINKY